MILQIYVQTLRGISQLFSPAVKIRAKSRHTQSRFTSTRG